MYLGEPSLLRLWHFLNGYTMALNDYGIAYERIGIWRPHSRDLPDFHTFVALHFKESPASAADNYATRILRHANGDERTALETFWMLLDEYHAQEQALENQVLPNGG